ncbi:MAG: MBL fold metallo-hydrolase [Clostridiales bacterium]|nr:MBL fold metallo-hydrolase [Clostridiales bacterium]
MFQLGDKTVVVDPYLSNSVAEADGFERMVPAPFSPQELKADMIVCTHDHMDHLDEETIKYTDFSRILYAGPDSCIKHYRAIGIPGERLISLNIGQSVGIGDGVIHGVYAAHTQDSIGVVIEYDSIACYLVGDSLYDERLLEAGRYAPDVLLCCINGKLGNMNYLEAAGLAEKLGVKVAIPCHYGMFKENTEDPEKFLEELQIRGIPGFIVEYNRPYRINDIINSVKGRK